MSNEVPHSNSSNPKASEKNYHHGDLKTALVDAALDLLTTRGAEALSLRSLASEVGVSHMAPYAHFKNKPELFQAIAASGFEQLHARMEQANVGQAPLTLILDYGTQYIEYAITNPALYKLMLSQTQIAPEMSEDLSKSSKRPHALLVDAFSKAPQTKVSNSVRAQGAWAMVHGLATLLIDGHLSIPDKMSIRDYLAATSTQVQIKSPL